MKFAHFSHVWNKPGMTAAERYAQLWRELAACDEIGFDSCFAVEHHFNPNESWMPSPSIYCAVAAARTRRMRVGAMGYVAPLYDPLRIAEDAAVLDNLMNGRLELGLVAGIVPDFFGPYRADFNNRRLLTHEALTFVKQALSSDGAFSFDGPVHQYQNVTLSVKPLQKPHPPLWIHSRDAETLAFLMSEAGVAHQSQHQSYLLGGSGQDQRHDRKSTDCGKWLRRDDGIRAVRSAFTAKRGCVILTSSLYYRWRFLWPRAFDSIGSWRRCWRKPPKP